MDGHPGFLLGWSLWKGWACRDCLTPVQNLKKGRLLTGVLC